MNRNRLQKELGRFLKVENMVSDKGNKIVNQFIIKFMNGVVFQSYESIIAVKFFNSDKVLLGDDWNLSRTTAKYRNAFLGCSSKDIDKKLESGHYKMITVYNNEIIPDDFISHLLFR